MTTMQILATAKKYRGIKKWLASYFWLILIFLGVLIYVSSGVIWIGLYSGSGLLLYYLWRKMAFTNNAPVIKLLASIVRFVYAILCIFMIGISVRLLFFEIYAIPSSSMESALVPGDKIVVNKLAYGPALPQSPFEIPWVNLLFYLASNEETTHEKDWWGYRRLKGFSKVREGDVLVFNKHKHNTTPFIKRCVAGPGRELVVSEGKPDHLKDWRSLRALIPVDIWSRAALKVKKRLDSMNLQIRRMNMYGERKSDATFHGRLPVSVIQEIRSWDEIDSMAVSAEANQLKSKYLRSIDSTWTIYDFGPLLVPYKGMKVTLNDRSFKTYKKMIRNFEGVNIQRQNDRFFVNGSELFVYEFRQDYYFMMGDNREDSNDSRYSQFIPEQNIIGRADRILLSNDWRGINWERLWTKL